MNRARSGWLIAVLLVVLSGCNEDGAASSTATPKPDVTVQDIAQDTVDVIQDVTISTILGPDGQPITGGVLGEACAETPDCRTGLSCSAEGTCQPTGESAEGTLCGLSAECAEGLGCSLNAMCAPSAGVEEGGGCGGPLDCAQGLRCELVGFTGVCEPAGEAGLGGACAANSDCHSPLMCGPGGLCTIPVFGGVRFPEGIECAPNEEGNLRVYFETSRESGEFYRLPFPNDALRTTDGIDMTGHYNPGVERFGGALIGGYLDALASETPGFSTNPRVMMRFSGPVDFATLNAGGDSQNLYFLNIDPTSSNYGRGINALFWTLDGGRHKYICQNALIVRGTWNSPLEPNTTYAVILGGGIRDAAGNTVSADADFSAVMAGSAPSDPVLANAWQAYAPLRSYLADDTQMLGINPADVVGASVFTTMDPTAPVEKLREAAQATTPPALSDLTLCDASATSPCDGKSCISANGDFVQLHGTYEAPIWQAGARPYLEAGGGLAFNAGSGLPAEQGTETMCVSITIPTGQMPAEGWPTLMYAHGTGGDFLSHVRSGVAENVSAIDLDGEMVRFATVAIDGVQHGQRRGDSTLDPEVLFYNFANPQAARGNVYQGIADYFYLTRLVQSINIAGDASPTGNSIVFDPAQLYFFGHSQGATVGVPFAAEEPALRGAVFSGSGGSLVLSLLNKSNPVDIASATQFLLNDGEVNDTHPVLALLQTWIDPVDPLNFGPLFYTSRSRRGVPPLHVFQSYGLGDTYSPEPTMSALAASMRLVHGQPGAAPELPLAKVDLPTTENIRVGEERATAVLKSYSPSNGGDGHFVLTNEADAIEDYLHFLSTAVRDASPSVPD